MAELRIGIYHFEFDKDDPHPHPEFSDLFQQIEKIPPKSQCVTIRDAPDSSAHAGD